MDPYILDILDKEWTDGGNCLITHGQIEGILHFIKEKREEGRYNESDMLREKLKKIGHFRQNIFLKKLKEGLPLPETLSPGIMAEVIEEPTLRIDISKDSITCAGTIILDGTKMEIYYKV